MASEKASEKPVPGTAPSGLSSKRQRRKANAAAKSARRAAQSESRSRTALVLGGGAPNMALMAGALAALHDRGVTLRCRLLLRRWQPGGVALARSQGPYTGRSSAQRHDDERR